MASFTIDAPNGKSYTIEGENAEGALAALRKHLGESGAPSPKQPSIGDAAYSAVADIPGEIANEAKAGWGKIAALGKRGEMGPVEGLMATGSAALAVPQIAMSPIVGAARSLIGHPMAYLEHKAGEVINPEVAAKDDPQKMYDTAKGDVDLALSAGAPKRSIKTNAHIPSIEELKQEYLKVRNSPDVKEANIPIEDVAALRSSAETELLDRGFRPTRASAEDTFGELKNLTPKPPPEPTPAQRLQQEMNWETPPPAPRVADASVEDILAARRAFGETAKQRQPFPQQGATPDAAASQSVMRKIDDLVEQHAPDMIEANANYSGAKTAEALDARINKAELAAASVNSGKNIGNKIRQQAVQILTNPAARRGLKEDEVAMLKEVAEGNPTRNALRWWSNVFGGGGGLGAEVTGDIASRHLGPIGWLLSPIGSALKHIEGHLTVKAANKISEAIRARTPLGKAFESSAQKWNEAQDAFSAGASAKSYAALSIASRNLANTLGAAGLKIEPGQLMRPLQGTAPTRAEEEQQ